MLPVLLRIKPALQHGLKASFKGSILPTRSFHVSAFLQKRQPLIQFKGPRSKERGPMPPGTDSMPLKAPSSSSGAIEFWELEDGCFHGRLRVKEEEIDVILSGGAI